MRCTGGLPPGAGLLVWATQLVFYGLPWLTWNARPAVLFDLGARRFYIFNLVLYPQDFIFLTGLLILAAYSLFLFTAVAGRLWCGYACPQTVYTEIFMWVEHHLEGDRPARIRLDRSPWNANKFAAARWQAPDLDRDRPVDRVHLRRLLHADPTLGFGARVRLGPWETFWVLFYGFATHGNAGFMREQVCKYMPLRASRARCSTATR